MFVGPVDPGGSTAEPPREEDPTDAQPLATRVVCALLLLGTAPSVGAQFAWKQLDPAHAPPPQSGHAMSHDVVTGETILFSFDGDTWRWDGDDWTQLLPANAPSPRAAASMVFDVSRGVHVLFGGGHSGGTLGDLWEFDGTDWALVNVVGPGPSPRFGAPMAYDSLRGTILMGFGAGSSSPSPSDLWEFDGAQQTWTALPTLFTPSARWGAKLVYLAAVDRFALLGGEVPVTQTGLADTFHTFDRTTLAWTVGPPNPSLSLFGVSLAAPALTYDAARQALVLFGGRYYWNSVNTTFELHASGLPHHPLLGSSPSARSGAQMVYEPAAGTHLLFGGWIYTLEGGIDYGDTWVYGPASPHFPGNGSDVAIEVTIDGTTVVPGTGLHGVAPGATFSQRYTSPEGGLLGAPFALVASMLTTGSVLDGLRLLPSDPAPSVWVSPSAAALLLDGFNASPPTASLDPGGFLFGPHVLTASLDPGGLLFGPHVLPASLSGLNLSAMMQLVVAAPGLNPVNLAISNGVELRFF